MHDSPGQSRFSDCLDKGQNLKILTSWLGAPFPEALLRLHLLRQLLASGLLRNYSVVLTLEEGCLK